MISLQMFLSGSVVAHSEAGVFWLPAASVCAAFKPREGKKSSPVASLAISGKIGYKIVGLSTVLTMAGKSDYEGQVPAGLQPAKR